LQVQNVENPPLPAPRSTFCTYAVQNVDPTAERARISTFRMRPQTGAPRHPVLPLNAQLTFPDPAANAGVELSYQPIQTSPIRSTDGGRDACEKPRDAPRPVRPSVATR
jgi:hypothetical protein